MAARAAMLCYQRAKLVTLGVRLQRAETRIRWRVLSSCQPQRS